MKILIATAHPPYPPVKGDAVVAWNWLRLLAERHDVDIAYYDASGAAPPEELARVARRVLPVRPPRPGAAARLRALLSTQPASLVRFDPAHMGAALAPFVRDTDYDALIAINANLLGLTEHVRARVNVAVPLDAISLKLERRASVDRNPLRRAFWRRDAHAWRRHEAAQLARWDAVVYVADDDRRHVVGHSPHAAERVHVISNGVDADYFTPDGPHADIGRALVTSGVMSSEQSVSAVQWFLPMFRRLRAQDPQLGWYLVGRDPAPAIAGLDGHEPGVVVTGSVADVRPYLRSAAVYVAPLVSGAGIKNRVLEAMASGCPVVATSYAVAALGRLPEHPAVVRVADEQDTFSGLVLGLLQRPAEARAQGIAGAEHMRRHHSWQAAVARLESLIAETARARRIDLTEAKA